jgi:hypothetical protein
MTPSQVIEYLREILEEQDAELAEDTLLLGGSSSVDSMSLVQLCLMLEEAALAQGFSFDWTSEKAMSSMNSVFRTPRSISNEFNTQFTSSQQTS